MATVAGLARQYDRLTVEERVKLALLARARGDEAEEERLMAAAPRRAFTRAEGAERVFIVADIAGYVWGAIWRELGALRTAILMRWLAQVLVESGIDLAIDQWHQGYADGMAAAVGAPKASRGKPRMGEERIERLLEASDTKTARRLTFLDEIVRDKAGEVKTILAAFDDWTLGAVGVDGQTVLRAWAPGDLSDVLAADGADSGATEPWSAAPALAAAEPDATERAELLDMFKDVWSGHVGG